MKVFKYLTMDWQLLVHFIQVYWKSLFLIFYPVLLMPVFLADNRPALRCLYIVLLMAGLWVSEAIPLPVTSLLPIILFPLMGILGTDETCVCYLKESNMMFIGGLIIAIAIEHSKLHTRVALYIILLIGCSARKLNLGLATVTMLVSMWISNTAATAMMIPIMEATLKELEAQGVGTMYEPEDEIPKQLEQGVTDVNANNRKPTKATMCYFISTAYAASIGGIGCLVGSGTNLTFKGIFETAFPHSYGIDFTRWLLLNVPLMVAINYLTVIWLQFWYMGLFRPKSEDAKKIDVSDQGQNAANKIIKDKIKELGPMDFHQLAVAICFFTAVILWLFRSPQFVPGWSSLIPNVKVKDSTAAMIVVLALFVLPKNLDFLHIFKFDHNKRIQTPADGLVTWKVVTSKLPWGLIFLLGGGFALAEGSKKSGMSHLIAEHLNSVVNLPPFLIMVVCTLCTTILTQFSSNVAVCNVVLPVVIEVARIVKVHPLYLMLPTAISCSFAYCLPVSTPCNAIAAEPCNMKITEMVKVGFGVSAISLLTMYAIYPFLLPLVWTDLDTFPDWAIYNGTSSKP